MNKPNIFKYATSELSQDAIICYILEWAKNDNKKLNNQLHDLAINFLDSLFNKFEEVPKPLEYKTIEIKKQYRNIDILCIVNNTHSIIIEDKTNTKNHSNQLQRYFEQIKKDFSNTEVLPIYFKTGDQSNYDKVLENGYKVYSREDFLQVLKTNKVNNNIIEEYTHYLQNIEDNINSYKILPIEKWNYQSWKGFFITLRKELNDGNWDYVSNPRGGFLGFWWNWDSNDKYQIYLQIDHSIQKITFKLYTKNNHKIEKSIVNMWKKHIICNSNNTIIKKPQVVRTGKSVTIGILENEFRVTDNRNIIDINQTVEYIREIEQVKLNKFTSFQQNL